MRHTPVAEFEAAKAVKQPENAHCDIKDANAVFRAKSAAISTIDPEEASEASGSVSYTGRVPSCQTRPVGTREPAPWYNRRVVGGYKVGRVITKQDRDEAYARWRHADRRGTPLNRHVIFKPDVNHLGPVGRMRLWESLRQKIRCQCRASGFDCAMISTRESDPTTHNGEHMHVLLHVPRKHQATFDRLVPGWAGNTVIQPANQIEVREGGKVSSAWSYLHKAAAPQSTFTNKSIKHRSSGAVAGPRTWGTMNLRAKARRQFEITRTAQVRIHQERSSIGVPVTLAGMSV